MGFNVSERGFNVGLGVGCSAPSPSCLGWCWCGEGRAFLYPSSWGQRAEWRAGGHDLCLSLRGGREETCRVDLSVSYQYRGLLLWIWDNRALVCVGIEGGGTQPEAGRRRGVDSLETRADPSDTNRWDGPTFPVQPPTSVLVPGGPQPPPLLLPTNLGHEVGIGGGLGSQVLGLGDIEEDVHNVSGDVQGQSDLGAPVTLGLFLGWPPLELCLGRVLVPGAAGPAATAAAHGAREGPFLCVLLLLPLLVIWVSAGQGGEGPLDQPRRVLPLTLLGLTQGCVEAAEAGTGYGGPLGEARLGAPEEQ